MMIRDAGAMDDDVTTAPPSVLVLIRDNRLREEVRRVAAAAGRRLVECEPPAGRHSWAVAPLIVLDTEAARVCAAIRPPRRAGVVTVTDGEPELADWQAAAVLGAEQVVALPGNATTLIEKFAEYAEQHAEGGIMVAVTGAGGGAGASTLAAALALRGAGTEFRPHTVLVDGAPYGGGLDLVLGMEGKPGLRWPDLVVDDGRVAAAELHDALPAAAAGLSVLSCGRGPRTGPIAASAVHAVIEAARGAGDLVVCDISSERGAHAERVLDAADLIVLVVPARLRAVAAARAASGWIARWNPNQGLVVRGPAPGDLRGHDIAEVLELPLLAAVRAQPGLPARLERGGLRLRRGPLRTATDAVLAVLGPSDERRSK